ncbi:MAG: sigma-70 family RNA polymerase sigma factor [Oscillospiraceae bacterium]|nr:sigma-70 family RNA polymerase sigma factor [Oscillospiraceae bacterium]
MREGTVEEIVKSPSLIVEKYFDMVYRLARKVAGEDKADDATQNVFMRYMKHCREFDTEEHVKAWLLRVTYNCANTELKNTWTERTTGIPENEDRYDEFAIEEPDIPDDGDSTIYRAVQKLPEKFRTVIHLYYYEDCPTKEIARITGQKDATVRTILARGRKRLEQILAKEGQLI